MAIDTGLAIGCTDLQSTGGISQILLREWTTDDVITYDTSSPTVHSILSILDAAPATTADWFVYEFKNETPALTINATKENGSTAFECGLTFMLPKTDVTKYTALQGMLNSCMMGIAIDTNGNKWVLGVSQLYANEDVAGRSQTFLNLSGFEGGTGAAYSDENGITVNLMARQFELPRYYAGTVDVNTEALTATTAA